METFQLNSDEMPSAGLRNCGNCVHRYEERMPGQLMPSLVCHRFPPQVVAVPAPPAPANVLQVAHRPQGIQYQMMSMFPIVQAQQFCHAHDLRPAAGIPSEGVSISDPDSIAGRNSKDS